MFERSGLRASAMSYVSIEHDPFGWIQSALNKVFDDDNGLTRRLMGLDKATVWNTVALAAAAVLFVPALLLAIASWIAGEGAILQVTGSSASST